MRQSDIRSQTTSESKVCRNNEENIRTKANMIAERINLFCHILEIIVDPAHPARPRREQSHPPEVSIDELESVTDTSLADFYAASDKNGMKVGYMMDLFQVAKLEEKYRRGELRKTIHFSSSRGAWLT